MVEGIPCNIMGNETVEQGAIDGAFEMGKSGTIVDG